MSGDYPRLHPVVEPRPTYIVGAIPLIPTFPNALICARFKRGMLVRVFPDIPTPGKVVPTFPAIPTSRRVSPTLAALAVGFRVVGQQRPLLGLVPDAQRGDPNVLVIDAYDTVA